MAANDKTWLEDHHITHILSITEGSNPTYPEVFIKYDRNIIEI